MQCSQCLHVLGENDVSLIVSGEPEGVHKSFHDGCYEDPLLAEELLTVEGY